MDTEGEAPGTKATAFATTLTLVENKSGYPVAYSAESKGGPSHACLAAAICRWLDHLGIGRVRLRRDNDVRIQALVAAIAKHRRPTVSLTESTPLYSSASNRRAERMIQTVRRQAVCLTLGIERGYGQRLTANHTLWPWVVRHAAWSQARFHVKANRKTCYEEGGL